MLPRFGFPHAAGRAAIISALAIFRQSVAADFDGSSYARNVSLDANVDIFWTIDTAAETIRVAVHAKAASGWAGVGISEMGGMEGADIVFYETATGTVTDAHSLAPGRPVIDECTQDWTLLSAEAGDGSLVFEAERALDTGDAQDRVFGDDTQDGSQPTRLIAAWGDEESMEYHGTTNFAKGEVVMFGGPENADLEPDVESDPAVSFFDVTQKNFPVPTVRTHYEQTCFPASELPEIDEFHAIAFEGVVQNDTSEYVHHLVLTGWTDTPDCGRSCEEWLVSSFPSQFSGDDYGSSSSSDSPSPPSSSSPSSEYYSFFEANNITIPDFCFYDAVDIFLWGPGSGDMYLPEDVGFFFGDALEGYSSLSLETHYNNPNGDAGKTDSSGVRVYYTEELRPLEMGVIRLGDPDVALDGTPLPDGKMGISFTCPSSCTEEYFEVEEVTVFSHFLHMHENGQRLQTRQYRNDSSGNEVMVHTAEVEYYSFLQAAGFVVSANDSVTIQKGDRFETECFYDTALSSVGSDNVTFGLGSEQEMCIDYVFYYPNQRIPYSGSCGYDYCNGSIDDVSVLEAGHDFDRIFGIVDTCTTGVAEDLEDADGTEDAEDTEDAGDAEGVEVPDDDPADAEEGGSTSISSARARVPGLGLIAFSATAALVVGSITVAFGVNLE